MLGTAATTIFSMTISYMTLQDIAMRFNTCQYISIHPECNRMWCRGDYAPPPMQVLSVDAVHFRDHRDRPDHWDYPFDPSTFDAKPGKESRRDPVTFR